MATTKKTDDVAPSVPTADDVLERLRVLGLKRERLRREEEDVMAEMRDLVAANVTRSAMRDPSRPVPQLAAANAAGVDRMTIREWVGVRRRTAAERAEG